MDPILEFLNQPIILTLVTLTIGSYLLSLVAERRSRRNVLKDKAIEFLGEAGEIYNQFSVQIFGKLRNDSIEVDRPIEQAVTELYSKRMGIEVGSRAYLKSDAFFKDYFNLMDSSVMVVVVMKQVGQGTPHEEAIHRIQEFSRELVGAWPLEGENTVPDGDTLIAELILYEKLRKTHLL